MKPSIGAQLTKIIAVDPDSFKVRLRFEDDHEGELDLHHLFAKPKGLAAEVLKGGMFQRCFVESGALAWPNGLELCADAIRRWMDEQANRKAA